LAEDTSVVDKDIETTIFCGKCLRSSVNGLVICDFNFECVQGSLDVWECLEIGDGFGAFAGVTAADYDVVGC
jgi:hypothetical protein